MKIHDCKRPLSTSLLCAFLFFSLAAGNCTSPPAQGESSSAEPGSVSESSQQEPEPTFEAPTLEAPNAQLAFDQIMVGGQPTEADLEKLAASGVKTIINMRTAGEPGSWEEAPKASELGITYRDLPISGADDLTPENAQVLADLLGPEALPAFVHCASGNRVGGLFAVKAFHLDGKSLDEAMEIGEKSGLTRMAPVVRELLEGDGSE